ncbi:MAG: hypothetical protein ACE5E6_07665 [Phycisphaerae bacterium]
MTHDLTGGESHNAAPVPQRLRPDKRNFNWCQVSRNNITIGVRIKDVDASMRVWRHRPMHASDERRVVTQAELMIPQDIPVYRPERPLSMVFRCAFAKNRASGGLRSTSIVPKRRFGAGKTVNPV